MKAPILLASLLVLTACQNTSAPIDHSAHSSVSAMDSSSASNSISSEKQDEASTANAETWLLLKTWAPTVSWSAPAADTNDDQIHIDNTRSIPAGALQATSVSAVIDLNVFNAVFMKIESRTAIDALVFAQGWQRHSWLEADGATGTMWGYKMSDADGVRFLIVHATGNDCATSNDRPVECSKFDATVTVTDTIAPGDDL